jgi:hypothetical protein
VRTSLAAGVLDAVSVLVDVLFAMVVAVAVVVAVDLVRRWLRAASARKVQQQEDDPAREPMPVHSWRPRSEPRTVALPASPPSTGTYGVRPRGQRFPEDDGRLL